MSAATLPNTNPLGLGAQVARLARHIETVSAEQAAARAAQQVRAERLRNGRASYLEKQLLENRQKVLVAFAGGAWKTVPELVAATGLTRGQVYHIAEALCGEKRLESKREARRHLSYRLT